MAEYNVNIEGAIIRELKQFTDDRGVLAELFRQDELDKELYPVMGYASTTYPGKSRGPHEHIEQTDYFFFPGTTDFELYLWDNRKGSPGYGKKTVTLLPKGKAIIVIIPPNVVHAYKNIGKESGLVLNFPNRLYAGKGKKEKVDEVRYEEANDARFKI